MSINVGKYLPKFKAFILKSAHEEKKETLSNDKGSTERTTAHITLNGEILHAFHLRSETGQGNSLSSLLFNINMETLIHTVKQ